jgi:hypothetical protein
MESIVTDYQSALAALLNGPKAGSAGCQFGKNLPSISLAKACISARRGRRS